MSESFEIRSSTGSYRVLIERGAAAEMLDGDQRLLLIDAALESHHPWLMRDDAIRIEASEVRKTLETVAQVIEAMKDRKAHRRSHIVAVGGGIVQDIATFAASSYMRGVTWTYLPTTLLGMVDSCIGGKSSINVGRYKNIAGNYYPPSEILVDTQFCESLAAEQKVAGLCEAAKITFADEGAAFDRYLDLMTPFRGAVDFSPVIAHCLRTKKKFVEEDEFDQGIRLLLNFGHTFGHALEASTHFAVSHGVAVGLGILSAIRMSELLGIARHDRTDALDKHIRQLLSQLVSLPHLVAGLDVQDALTRFRADKKHRPGDYAVIIPNAAGYLERRFIPADAANDARITEAFQVIRTYK